MSKLSVSEAAKRFQVSRPTLQKALKDGTISGKRLVHNGVETWQIDVSELARVYSLRGEKNSADFDGSDDGLTGKGDKENINLSSPLHGELEAMREKLAEAEKQAAVATARAEERQAQIDSMRHDLEAARQEKAALLAALPKPDQSPAHEKPGFFRAIFGGKK